MPHRAVACIVLLLLAGCGGGRGTGWDRPGATRAEFDRDVAGCYAQAAERFQPMRQNNAPAVNVQIGQPRGVQFNDGSNLPAPDLNSGGRQAAYRSCMMERGWTVSR